MTDDLESRLRAADPAKSADSDQPPPSWISHLVEETMKDDTTIQRRRWQLPAAAAAALVLGVGGYAVAQNMQGDSHSAPSASAAPLKLSSAVSGIGTNACIQFTAGLLAQKPVAFSGTVKTVGKTAVLVDVDHWYRGGDTKQVQISVPGHSQVSIEGSVNWTAGQRYLVTATGKVVSGCGYTVAWNAHTAAVFAKAFGH